MMEDVARHVITPMVHLNVLVSKGTNLQQIIQAVMVRIEVLYCIMVCS